LIATFHVQSIKLGWYEAAYVKVLANRNNLIVVEPIDK
jgi:hypothetical protein